MNWKAIVALVAVLAAGIPVLLWLSGREPDKPSVGGGRIFPGLRQKDIGAISVDLRTGPFSPMTVAAQRAGAAWTLSQPVVDEANSQTVDRVLNAFVRLAYTRRLDPAEAGDEDYGFEPPAITITATQTDGTQLVVRLGKPTSMDAHVYARVDGRPDVYLVRNPIVAHCRQARPLWRNPRVLATLPMDAIRVEVRSRGSGGDVTLERKGNGSWMQTTPVEDRADVNLVMGFLSLLHLDAQAGRFHDPPAGRGFTAAELKQFGLDAPFLKVKVTDGTGEVESVSYGTAPTVLDGKSVPGLFAYRHRDGRVLECLPLHAKVLQSSGAETYFRQKALIELPPAAIDRVTVREPDGDEWELKREGRIWSVAKPRPLKGDPLRFTSLITQMPNLVASTFVDGVTDPQALAARGLDDAQAWRVKLGTADASEVLWIGAENDRGQRNVRRNASGQVYLVKRQAVEALTGRFRGWVAFLDRRVWEIGHGEELATMTLTLREGGDISGAFIHKADAGWTPAPGNAITAAGAKLADLASMLAGLRAGQWFEDDPTQADLKRFGLLGSAGSADAAAPDGWIARVDLTLGAAAKGRKVQVWLGKRYNIPGTEQWYHFFRVTKGAGMYGDLVGIANEDLLNRIRGILGK